MQHHQFIVVLMLHVSLSHEQPLVEISVGTVRGHYKRSYGGRNFLAFEGIPYAKPPVGDLRFEEPQDMNPWPGIWEATMIHECMQFNTQNFDVVGNEDCLYLNVYVGSDTLISNKSFDVIVHFHGGAFMYGSPTLAGPEYLMDRDIIYVNLNYRVGLLGFLSTEDNIVLGNNGLKDQVIALRWIQNNIRQFGGNPNSVTITGLSAGGAAVQFHYLSPLSKGLFHRGISQSGTVLVPWALQEAPLEKTKKLAVSVGCNAMSTREVVECLKQRSAKQLVAKTSEFFKYLEFPLSPFAPVIEKTSKTAFLTDHPYKLLETGQINDLPWIASVTTQEGIFPVIKFFNKLDDIEKCWNEVAPYLLDYNDTVAEEYKNDVSEKIKSFYFNKKKVSLVNIQSIIKLFGDRYFTLDYEKAVRMQTKMTTSPVYSYIYGYKGEQSLNSVFGSNRHYGIAHGEDGFLLYNVSIFGMTFMNEKLSESDKLVKELLLDLITSFAKNGKPQAQGISWQPLSTDSHNFGYLYIYKPDDIRMVFQDKIASKEFWHSLPILENQKIASVKDEL